MLIYFAVIFDNPSPELQRMAVVSATPEVSLIRKVIYSAGCQFSTTQLLRCWTLGFNSSAQTNGQSGEHRHN
jgi:hypothetical protein